MLNKKILIIVESSTQKIYFGTHPPLGPLYIVAYLRAKRIDVDFIDRNVDPDKHIDFKQYDIVGFSVNVNNIERTIKSAIEIKRNHPYPNVVVGGPFASAYPEALLKLKEIDSVIVGEGEYSFYEYCLGTEKSDIKGLYFKENGRVYFTGRRNWIHNLDELPFPAIDILDIDKYNILITKKRPFSSIITSRGCPYRCIFCFHNLGWEWRDRSPNNVVNEIEWQVKELGIKELLICDDNFSFDLGRAKVIFAEIKKRKINVYLQLSNGVRADFVDKELLEKMHAAGLWNICFAPETGSRETFHRLNKNFRLEDVYNAVKMAKKIGISTMLNIMIGFPWETKEDFVHTFNFIRKLDVDFVDITRAFPFPGTHLGALSNNSKIDNDIFHDRSYFVSQKTDSINRIVTAFYRSFYSNLLRLFRVFVALELYSPFTLYKISKVVNIFYILRNRFGLLGNKADI